MMNISFYISTLLIILMTNSPLYGMKEIPGLEVRKIMPIPGEPHGFRTHDEVYRAVHKTTAFSFTQDMEFFAPSPKKQIKTLADFFQSMSDNVCTPLQYGLFKDNINKDDRKITFKADSAYIEKNIEKAHSVANDIVKLVNEAEDSGKYKASKKLLDVKKEALKLWVLCRRMQIASTTKE